ncbi:MAG: CAP domain-containing protein [Pseudomonadota bacterium]
MTRMWLALVTAAFLAACTAPTDPNGPSIFRIRPGDAPKIQLRHVEAVNAVRQANGLGPVQLNAQLNAAAATHSRDMSRQNRPWHFGSDGSNPIERVARTGYAGRMLAENISETLESDLQTLEAWLRDPVTRMGILHPDARNIGFAWTQESNGKIWWVQVLGS